jgi:hypothetical protein
MEAVVPGGEIQPLIQDTGTLTVTDVVDDDDGIRSIYDVPFVSVFWVGDEIHAEVYLTGVADIDHDRLMAAQSVAGELGFRAYARVFGDWGQVLFRFSDDPAKGLIWALEEEMVSDWSL